MLRADRLNVEAATAHNLLRQWGAWQRATIDPKPRAPRCNLGFSIGPPTEIYDAAQCQLAEWLILRGPDRDRLVLQSIYIDRQSDDRGAEWLTEHGYPCTTRQHFGQWAREALARVDGGVLMFQALGPDEKENAA